MENGAHWRATGAHPLHQSHSSGAPERSLELCEDAGVASEDYAREKFWGAVSCLAVSPAPIQQRLERAASCLHTLKPDDFGDKEAGERFALVMAALSSTDPVGSEGSFSATCAAMSDEDAAEIARAIFELDSSLRPLI